MAGEGAVSAVTPNSGGYGTVATIQGTNLYGGGTSVNSITLDGTEVDTIVSHSNEEMVVVVAASNSAAGFGDIRIVSNTGAFVVSTGTWQCLQNQWSTCSPLHQEPLILGWPSTVPGF